MSSITIVKFARFKSIVVLEMVSEQDRRRIRIIKDRMSFDEYAGYSPVEQEKRRAIVEILAKYKQPEGVEVL